MSKKIKIGLVIVGVFILYIIANLTMPIWLTWIGKTMTPDLNLPSESQLEGMYKPKNLLPMYGYTEKTEDEKKADEEFTNEVTKKYGDRKKASQEIIKVADEFYQRGEIDTAMKRYNQAWLLDNNNPNAYIGFGDILKKQGYDKEAVEMYKKAEELKK